MSFAGSVSMGSAFLFLSMTSFRSTSLLSLTFLGLAAGAFSFSPAAHGAIDRGPLSIEIIASDYKQTLAASDFASWFQTDTQLVAGNTVPSEIEDTSYCPTDALYCVFSLSRGAREHMAIRSVKTVNEENIRSFVATLAPQINQEPKDAIFGVGPENQIIVSEPEKLGRLLDENESTALILHTLLGENTNNLSLSLTLPTEVAKAKSRFETGNATPVHSVAHLDFTIIIPEFVWLRLESVEHSTRKSMRHPSVVLPLSRTWRTKGNGGDIVIVNSDWAKLDMSSPQAAMRISIVDFAVAAP